MSGVTIYHNPKCSTSRNALEFIREAGIEPQIVLYLDNPLSEADLKALAKKIDGGARGLLRTKEPLAEELGLKDEKVSDDKILKAIAKNPILFNRPVVSTPKGTRACRPSETVKDLL